MITGLFCLFALTEHFVLIAVAYATANNVVIDSISITKHIFAKILFIAKITTVKMYFQGYQGFDSFRCN